MLNLRLIRRVGLLIVVLVLCVSADGAAAQSFNQSVVEPHWVRTPTLGMFTSVSPSDSLPLELERAAPPLLIRHAGVGLLVGAGVGLLVGLSLDAQGCEDCILPATAITLPLGATIGIATGVVVYLFNRR